MQIPQERLAGLLNRVQKPARYAGQEWNSVVKDWRDVEASIALCYPDLYEIGMSNLGLAILYDLVNRSPRFVAERAYTPWDDFDALMREEGLPLYSLETRRTLDEFDVLGFSLQHELNFTNVLTMLDLAGLPVRAAERTAGMPLVIAGGSCTYNPAPLARFIDAFVIGEGEEVTLELLDAVAAWKREAPGDRDARLRRLAAVPGVYVPALYDGEGRPLPGSGAPERVKKRIASTLPPIPRRPIVPTMQPVHDRIMLEIQRGCSRGCRFCQAGMIYRPIRERPVEEILDALDEVMANTGHAEVSFVSLSSSDHSGIEALVQGALERHPDDALAVSLPSLRIDSFSVRLAEMIQSSRKTGFTFAPEAGSQRLRDVINKCVTEEDLLRTTAAAFENGWNRVKLYFMMGLPTETDEDVLEIARLVHEIADQGRRIRRRPVDVAVSVSTFVPKPHTPFQWSPLADRETVARRQSLLRERIRGRHLALSYSSWDDTWLEAVLARGDARLGGAIERAWRAGARFDAWREHYRPDVWRQALEDEGLGDGEEFTRERAADEALPWEVLDIGVTPRFLRREFERALEGALSPDCRVTCHGCGVSVGLVPEYEATAPSHWGCP